MADLSTPTHDAQSVQTAESLITQNIDIWTTAIERKSSAGRGSSNKYSLYGIKKLRELILELAVRGKLVPQASREARNSVEYEPASVLLERIVAEKAQLVKEGELKKQKPLPEISDDEKPFELPQGWSFVRLGNITTRLGSGSTPRGGQSAYVDHGIPFLRSQNVWNDGLKLDDIVYITHETHEVMSNTKVLGNDVLLNITGASLGRTTVFPTSIGEANVNQHVTIIRLINIEMCKFVHLGLMSPMVQKLVWGRQVGMAIEGLSKKVLEQFEFPIPPLEEQHRIVAKVDELMSLCDALEAQTEASIAAHQTLVETLLNALLLPNTNQPADSHSASPEPALNDSYADSWGRVAEHFDTLFTTTASIDSLKQTILQLAVMGKLVPQASCEARNSPNYEPAAKLLARIAAEKAQLFKDGKIKKQKPLPAITDEEKPFELPKGWEWVRFGTLFKSFSNGLYKPAKFYTDAGVISLRMYNIQSGMIDFSGAKRVEVEPNELTQFLLEPNDLLINRVNSKELVGKTAIIPITEEPLVYESMNMRAKPFSQYLSAKYLNLFMMTGLVQESISTFAKEAIGQASINQGQVSSIKTPLPPLEEQHRIVDRVEELMALCDQLKARLSDAQTTQLHLADAIVEEAV